MNVLLPQNQNETTEPQKIHDMLISKAVWLFVFSLSL